MLLRAAYRGQLTHRKDKVEPSRKRPREDDDQPQASHQPMHTKGNSHCRRMDDLTGLPEGQQAQSGTESTPGVGSALPADSRVSKRAPASVGRASHKQETALPAGSSAQGRASSSAPGAGASSRAPWPAKVAPAQPAFIRIAGDEPHMSHRQSPSSSAFGNLHGNQRLSTAVQTDALTTKPVQGTLGPHRLAVPASATSRSATASLPTHSSVPYTCTVSAVPVSQATGVAVDCTGTSQPSSHAHQPTVAEQAATPSAVMQTQAAVPIAGTMTHVHESAETDAAAVLAAVPAASGTPMAVIKPGAPAQVGIPGGGNRIHMPESARTVAAADTAAVTAAVIAAGIAASPLHTTMPDAAAQQHEGGSTHTPAAAGTPTRGSVSTPVLIPASVSTSRAADLQGSRAAVQPRAVLPSSRRKRKGPKVANALEPVKAEDSWQALLGPDDGGWSEASPRTLLTGMIAFLAVQQKGLMGSEGADGWSLRVSPSMPKSPPKICTS